LTAADVEAIYHRVPTIKATLPPSGRRWPTDSSRR